METAKSWAEKIEEYLEATGERTTSIAVALRVSEDAVRKWRRGDRQPDGPAQICLERLFAAAKRRLCRLDRTDDGPEVVHRRAKF